MKPSSITTDRPPSFAPLRSPASTVRPPHFALVPTVPISIPQPSAPATATQTISPPLNRASSSLHTGRRHGPTLLLLLALLVLALGCLIGPKLLSGLAFGKPIHPMPTSADQVLPLDPELAARFETARRDAREFGLNLTITSGSRSIAEQQDIITRYTKQYGADEAHRLALPPRRSPHVRGLAIDVGPAEAATWLADRQSAYGLCQTYANEPWHFEASVPIGQSCPKPVLDAAQAPNNQ